MGKGVVNLELGRQNLEVRGAFFKRPHTKAPVFQPGLVFLIQK